MKNRVIALMMVSALLFSSISLALSLTSRSKPEAQEHSSIPPEAFTGLGSKKGVGFGDWKLDVYPLPGAWLKIFSYPAGATSEGWDGYLVDMLITVTVELDWVEVGGPKVDVTFRYLMDGVATAEHIYLRFIPHSVTFTGQIYEVILENLIGDAECSGHYFVSADRRV